MAVRAAGDLPDASVHFGDVDELLRDMAEANKAYVDGLSTGDPFTGYRRWRGRQ